MPDVTFQGLNRIRVLVDKNIPAELYGYIAAEKDFNKQGFHQAMYDIGTASGKVYALPFAISLPIVYVNVDLSKKPAPIRQPSADLRRLIDLAKKIKHSAPTSRHHLRLRHHRKLAVAGAVFARAHHAERRRTKWRSTAGSQFAIKTLARLVTESVCPTSTSPPCARLSPPQDRHSHHLDLRSQQDHPDDRRQVHWRPHLPRWRHQRSSAGGGNVMLILAKTRPSATPPGKS